MKSGDGEVVTPATAKRRAEFLSYYGMPLFKWCNCLPLMSVSAELDLRSASEDESTKGDSEDGEAGEEEGHSSDRNDEDIPSSPPRSSVPTGGELISRPLAAASSGVVSADDSVTGRVEIGTPTEEIPLTVAYYRI